MIKSDFNETLYYTYRLYKKMNLENIRCDGKNGLKRWNYPLYKIKNGFPLCLENYSKY